jgi:hypothetical protein
MARPLPAFRTNASNPDFMERNRGAGSERVYW